MTKMFLLSDTQTARISPFFPLSHGVPFVDDRRMIGGIIFVIRNGLRRRDVPPGYGPHKTICNRFIRRSRMGVFGRIFVELAGTGGDTDEIMINATHLKARRTAVSLLRKGLFPDIGRAKGGLNLKTHAVCDREGRPRTLFLTAGEVSDYTGAAALLSSLPPANALLAGKGYDADWFRDTLVDRGFTVCIPPR